MQKTRFFESLFILALDDDEGYIVESVVENLESSLIRAVLVELVMLGRISLEGGRILVLDQSSACHPVLDKVLNDLADAKKTHGVNYWTEKLISKKLPREIGQDLVDQGVILRHKNRLHLPASPLNGQAAETSLKFRIKNRLREVGLTGARPDQSEIITLAFLLYADLFRLVFTVGERKAAYKTVKKQIEEILVNDNLSDSQKAIRAIKALN